MLRLTIALLATLTFAACGSKPAATAAAPKPKPVVKTIAVIPATAPLNYSLRNRGGISALIPAAHLAYLADSRAKAAQFTQRLRSPPSQLGDDYTAAFAEQLRNLGYQVTILRDVQRPPDDPDGVDYETIKHDADALLHLKFYDVGVESPLSSTLYLPRVNARSILLLKGSDDYLYDETIYYGIDARAGKDWAIVADDKLGFPDFEYMLANLDLVRKTFDEGARQISQRAARQIHAAIVR